MYPNLCDSPEDENFWGKGLPQSPLCISLEFTTEIDIFIWRQKFEKDILLVGWALESVNTLRVVSLITVLGLEWQIIYDKDYFLICLFSLNCRQIKWLSCIVYIKYGYLNSYGIIDFFFKLKRALAIISSKLFILKLRNLRFSEVSVPAKVTKILTGLRLFNLALLIVGPAGLLFLIIGIMNGSYLENVSNIKRSVTYRFQIWIYHP